MRLLHQSGLGEKYLSAGHFLSDSYITGPATEPDPINTGRLRMTLRKRGLDLKREASGYRVIRRPA